MLSIISDEVQLEKILSKPSENLINMMSRIDGDIMILGIAGKMGITLGMLALKAIRKAGLNKKVIGVSRFSEKGIEQHLNNAGIETITCDLLDRDAVNSLPQVKNVIFMAGRKFGTNEDKELTWAVNVLTSANVASHFQSSKIIVFSTGCVYPLVPVSTGGCSEEEDPAPIGEYAQSCLGRERIFEHYSKINKTSVCLIRLNYAVDLRYGVLHDIGKKVLEGKLVNITTGYFNAIWQGDANKQVLLALEHCSSPASILNVTGPEIISVRWVAHQFGKIMRKKVIFTGAEGNNAYLSNSARASGFFGYPKISLEQMTHWQAHWLMSGGKSLNKATHFEVNNGNF